MRMLAVLVMMFVGCSGEELSATDTDVGVGGGSTSAGGAETTEDAPCETARSGSYAVSGSCFGMSMTVDLEMDVDTCSFVLDSWSMDHGNMPEGGTIDGEDVMLGGGDFEDCAGSVGKKDLAGVCPDGCAWELIREN